MQFVVIARDGTDAEAPQRRLRAREAHLANVGRLKEPEKMLMGGAMLDDNGTMVGSVMVFDFPDRARLEAWLKNDPYSAGGVWQSLEIKSFRVAVKS
jgi:uncharacterized protein YciI